MSGWIDEGEIHVEYEEILDTSPELYRRRTNAALNEKKYHEALKEAQLALKYGNNEWQYRALVAKVIFEMKEYKVCMKYIMGSALWEDRNHEIPDWNKLEADYPGLGSRKLCDLMDWLKKAQDNIYYYFGICYCACGYKIEESNTIIVSADEKGMYPNIQDAIDRCKENQTIYLTNGIYRSKEIVIRNKKVTIRSASNYSKATIFSKVIIENACAEIEGIEFNTYIYTDDDKVIINNSKVVLKSVRIGYMHEVFNGIFTSVGEIQKGHGILTKDSTVQIVDSKFEHLQCGIRVISGNVTIKKTTIRGGNTGIWAWNEKNNNIANVSIDNCEIVKVETGILADSNGAINVRGCIIDNGMVGIAVGGGLKGIHGGKIEVYNSEIYANRKNIVLEKTGNIKMDNCKISSGKEAGIVADGKVKLEISNCSLSRNRTVSYVSEDAVVEEHNVQKEHNHMFQWLF